MSRLFDASKLSTIPRTTQIALSSSDLLKTFARLSLVGLFCVSVLLLLHFGRFILVPVVAALLLGIMFTPLARKLARMGLGTFFASAVVVTLFMGVLGLGAFSLAVPLETWSSRVPEISYKLTAQWNEISEPLKQLKEVEKQVDVAAKDADGPMEVVVKPKGIVSNLIASAPDVAAWILLFVGTLYFYLGTREQLRRNFLENLTTLKARIYLARIFRDVERALTRYIFTTFAVNAVFGIVVGIAMYLLGIPSPHLWGALAMLLNFAPFIGPAVMTIILLGVSAVTFEQPGEMILAPLVFVALNLLEGQFTTPRVLGRTLTLNPLLVFLTLAFWLWMWGPVGAFLAVPMLLVFTVVLERVLWHNGYQWRKP